MEGELAFVKSEHVLDNITGKELNAFKLQEHSGDKVYVPPNSNGNFDLKVGQQYTNIGKDTSESQKTEGGKTVLLHSPTSLTPTKKLSSVGDIAVSAASVLDVDGKDLFLSPKEAKNVIDDAEGSVIFSQKGRDTPSICGAAEGVRLQDGARDMLFFSPLLQPLEAGGKNFQDPVHEYVHLPNVAIRIIDTVEFQRLRTVKQLGTVCFLYPAATHTRFEHSIGVAHLASEMLKHIASCQPELGITRADVLSVIIAGLCHDLGHGPFSHSFEVAVNRIRSKTGARKLWRHEHMSVLLLRRILKKIEIRKYGLNEDDVRFIELCITGLHPSKRWPENIGRPEKKRFLLEIVSNKRNGMDVDKLDYFHRDSIACYGRAAVDVQIRRLLKSCKVLCCEEQHQICFEEKMALSLGDIFSVRAKLHKHAYQHRVTLAIEQMMIDALYEAEPFFLVPGKNGRKLRLSECVDDEEAFCKLGDWILEGITASDDPRLAKSQSLIRRIMERDLYSVVGIKTFISYNVELGEDDIRNYMIQHCKMLGRYSEKLDSNLLVNFINITYDKTDKSGIPNDPIAHMAFYSPKNVGAGAFRLPKERKSHIFSPISYGEKSVIVFVKEKVFVDVIRDAFGVWVSAHANLLVVAVPAHNGRTEESPTGSAQSSRSQCLSGRADNQDSSSNNNDTVTILTAPRAYVEGFTGFSSSQTNGIPSYCQSESESTQASQCSASGLKLPEGNLAGNKRSR
ncbi:hypothetical protein, conserved [Trypanosoma brucei gambiense DAL972]|uniref:HD domain-containing protein n=1 Tax=Trypanosoma brucei gambiense (strain MHOM/CI/86/DAL972) TaxID=679716 RepID=C9ZQW1_TRYB9|nr:hypothetical protein, conserved [Trypanosoma brucei gambiense DAL972]CBH11791.1 hypothetical protein, conserved [Trypanosoma brucei gambiense DAL972]|eukprot:XP_011774076.1 hypothetical protein, conserved [Trypanosoma brucei gambiense DAL972]